MTTSRISSILPLLASLVLAAGPGALALGSHQGSGGGGTGVGGPTSSAVTYLTPTYCNYDSTTAPDSTEIFVNLSTNSRHSNLALQLTTAKNGYCVAYGAVRNDGMPTFSTMNFDTSGQNNLSFAVVTVTEPDGFFDVDEANLTGSGHVPYGSTTATTSGFQRYAYTAAYAGFDANATFRSGAVAQDDNDGSGPSKTLLVQNVQLNSLAYATGVLSTPTNDCLTIFDI